MKEKLRIKNRMVKEFLFLNQVRLTLAILLRGASMDLEPTYLTYFIYIKDIRMERDLRANFYKIENRALEVIIILMIVCIGENGGKTKDMDKELIKSKANNKLTKDNG